MSPEPLNHPILASGPVYEIVDDRGIACCVVQTPPELLAAEGAHAAREMTGWLARRVAIPASPFAGLILDVREGPPAFGPITRNAIEHLLKQADAHQVPVVAVVSANPIQQMQFTSLTREFADNVSKVLGSMDHARAWIRSWKPSN